VKLSVSLPGEDVRFLDAYSAAHELPSRSAALQQAIRALRDTQLSEAYADAWNGWDAEGDEAAWDATAGDGVG